MKSAKKPKTKSPPKRDLFAEISEGFDALAAERQGKQAINRVRVPKEKPDAFGAAAARRILKRTEW